MIRLLLLLLLPFGLVVGCDNSLEPRIGTERLVVEGWIDDQIGHFRLKLSTTTQYNSSGGFPAVSGATVAIMDDLGEIYPLTRETVPGTYQSQSDSLKGVVERSYILLITLPNGKKYQSAPEILKAVAPIDNLEGVLRFSVFDVEVGMSVTYSDPPQPGDFYRWNFYSDGQFLNRTNLILGDDRSRNGSQGRLEIVLNNLQLNSLVRVDQLSLTKSAHNFLQQLKSQGEDLGKTFGVAPSPIRGNIISLDDPDEVVLGYFGASSIKSEQFVLSF